MDDFGLLVGVHSTSLPTLSNNQFSTLQLDASGRLIIAGRFLEDAAHTSGDPGIGVLAVRNDVEGSLVGTDGDYAPLQVDASGRLRVIADVDVSNQSEKAEDAAHVSGDIGDFVLAVRRDAKTSGTSADGDYASLNVDADGDLYVSDTVSQGILTTINTSLDNIEASVADISQLEDAAHVSGDAGVMSLAVRSDVKASTAGADGDYAALIQDADGDLYVSDTVAQASLSSIDTSLNNIETDADAIAADIDALNKAEDSAHVSGDSGIMALVVRSDVKASTAGATGDYAALIQDADGDLYVSDTVAQGSLSNIDTSLNNIEADIDSITKLEDAVHSSGDAGVMALAVRNDSDTSLVSASGDYSPLQTDSTGRLKISGNFSPVGSEEYTTADALAAGGDGLITITDAYTTVASFAHTSGTAYLYGFSWACDKNAEMRIVTDDTTDIIVYKVGLNSSAMPGMSEHWNDGGRIEIPGSASLAIKLQVKVRASGGSANATGSMHIRK